MTDGAERRLPTPRALAKERTREKLLASARALFTQRGYEKATIRDIAAAAGMSTGAVFASFSDKSDLFNEVVLANRIGLYEAMRVVAESSQAKIQTVDATLLDVFDVAYRFHLRDLPLWQATMSASWSPDHGGAVRARLAARPMTQLVGDVLAKAVDRGELTGVADIALVAQMLWDGYLASYRHAVFDGWGLQALKTLLKTQISVVLAGSRTRPEAVEPNA